MNWSSCYSTGILSYCIKIVEGAVYESFFFYIYLVWSKRGLFFFLSEEGNLDICL